MEFDQVLSDLKAQKYKPLYFLTGDEDYFIDKITQFIEDKVLNETDKAFNQTVLYGKDVQSAQILENAKRFPMMAEKQVVIVKEAQHVKDIEKLAEYANNPLETTILAIAYKQKKVDGRTKGGKDFLAAVKKHGILFESKALYENQLPVWISNMVKKHGFTISDNSSRMLSEYLGNDLSKIEGEIEKLMINLPKGTLIQEDIIEKYIGISKEYNNFEYQKAIAYRDSSKAFKMADYLSKHQKEVHLLSTISILFSYFSKILAIHLSKDKSKGSLCSKLRIVPSFFEDFAIGTRNYDVRKTVEIIALLREFDAKCKGVDDTADTGQLVIDLTYRILN